MRCSFRTAAYAVVRSEPLESSSLGKELLPLAVAVEVLIGDKEASVARCSGLLEKLHSSFRRSAPRLPPIAGFAAADHILPGVFTLAMTRDDMVQSQLLGLLPAVLAGVLVPAEDLYPSHLAHRGRSLD